MAQEHETRYEVRLRHVPIRDYMSLQAYFDGMIREQQLIAVGSSGTGAASRLADLAVFVQQDIADPRTLLQAEVHAAQAAGRSHVDLKIALLLDAGPDARRMMEVTEELDRQSRSGALLTTPASDVVMDLLRWLATEIEEQLATRRRPHAFESDRAGDP